MTVQPFNIAIDIACNSNILFPLPLSPISTFLTDFAVPSPTLMSAIMLPMSSVSRLINVPGRLNRPHPWELLKASAALNRSTRSLDSPNTFPSSVRSNMFSPSISCISGTDSAFTLLSTMRLRRALRSPGAGRRTRFSATCFFLPMMSVLVPFLGAILAPVFCMVLSGFRWEIGVVLNASAGV